MKAVGGHMGLEKGPVAHTDLSVTGMEYSGT